jgi:hypothetical protein
MDVSGVSNGKICVVGAVMCVEGDKVVKGVAEVRLGKESETKEERGTGDLLCAGVLRFLCVKGRGGGRRCGRVVGCFCFDLGVVREAGGGEAFGEIETGGSAREGGGQRRETSDSGRVLKEKNGTVVGAEGIVGTADRCGRRFFFLGLGAVLEVGEGGETLGERETGGGGSEGGERRSDASHSRWLFKDEGRGGGGR